ncbi:MAG: SUMF1/EgtB/PvdO family nonheme iron enzyme [Planctomycetes bacterium]|nr:SUMF1/EgtB/PvdO family nonheme iron enzyme [Planctomycetota bacterium]
MTELEALLSGIVSEPLEETRWLVLADWLDENDDLRRGELLRLHRKLLATCCEPDAHPERAVWQARIVELIGAGVRPCVPQRVVELPGGVLMTFSFIPPGSFLRGSNAHESELPIRKVTLTKGFFLGVYPVTQEEWRTVMGNTPSRFKGLGRPVEQVSWDDCQEFCTKLSASLNGHATVRLPTESEWECACRAGTTSVFHFGDAISTNLANYGRDSDSNNLRKGERRIMTTDVGLFPANPWGLYDVHGNVWEWCEDRHGDYAQGDQTDPQGRSTVEERVLRGGSWFDTTLGGSGAGCRHRYSPADRHDHCGFRVCFHLD